MAAITAELAGTGEIAKGVKHKAYRNEAPSLILALHHSFSFHQTPVGINLEVPI